MSLAQFQKPNLKNVDPSALALCKFLYDNELLKQRKGLINNSPVYFFRRKFNHLIFMKIKGKLENSHTF